MKNSPVKSLTRVKWGNAAIDMLQDPDAERRQLDFADGASDAATSGSEKLNQLRAKLAAKEAANDNAALVQNAIAIYSSIPKGMGLRHRGFFMLGLTLKRLGLTDHEIMGHLSTADYDGSRRKKKAIDSVMKSLKSTKWAS